MSGRTLPRCVCAVARHSPAWIAEHIVDAVHEQTTDPRRAYVVMIDRDARVWIDNPDAAIPEEMVCAVTRGSDVEWIAAEVAGELLERGLAGGA